MTYASVWGHILYPDAEGTTRIHLSKGNVSGNVFFYFYFFFGGCKGCLPKGLYFNVDSHEHYNKFMRNCSADKREQKNENKKKTKSYLKSTCFLRNKAYFYKFSWTFADCQMQVRLQTEDLI